MKTAIIWIAVSSQQQTTEDKVSLPEQESQCRKWCEDNGYRVLEILEIPGESRYESDVITALEEFAEKGVFAYHRLREYWKRGGVDVLVCYHDSRLGRSSSLYTWVLENTIRAGIDIYRIMGGWITETDSTVQNAIGLLTATADLQRLIKMRKVAMPKRAERGLNVGPKPVFSHMTIRDDKGNDLKVVVDRSKQRLWDDVATLLLEGIAWDMIEQELYSRYGHVDDNGHPYKNRKFYDVLYTPMFWGNGAWNYRAKGKPKTQRNGYWIFDPNDPPPDGVMVFYGVHEAVYTGETAERVKSELRRRRETIKGKATPQNTKMFSSLLICNECGYNMSYSYSKSSGWAGYRCMSPFLAKHYPDRECSQRRYVSVAVIRNFIDDHLPHLLNDTPNIIAFFSGFEPDGDTITRRIESISKDIDKAEEAAKTLIRNQTKADPELESMYEDEINIVANRIKILKSERSQLQRSLPNTDTETTIRDVRIRELRGIGIAQFWQQPERTINQMLLGIFGRYRLVVEQGEIVGVDIAPYGSRTRTRIY